MLKVEATSINQHEKFPHGGELGKYSMITLNKIWGSGIKFNHPVSSISFLPFISSHLGNNSLFCFVESSG